MQSDLVLTSPEPRAITPMELIHQTIKAGYAPQEAAAIIKELIAMEQSSVRFQWEREERQSKIDFDDALKACQKEIERIVPDREREKGIKWATYTAIDNQIRSIYTKHDFAISFSQEPASGPDRMGVAASLTRSGISREFHREVPVVQPGQTSRADAEEAAYSRAQRYLVLRIFNISVGVDKAEMAPYENESTGAMEESVVMDYIASIEGSATKEELQKRFLEASSAAKAVGDSRAAEVFTKTKNKTWRTRGFKI